MKKLHLACLAGLLWLTGCATTTGTGSPPTATPAPLSKTERTPTSPPAKPPSETQAGQIPLSPITLAYASSSEVTSLSTPADLWDRIRRGFAMPDLEHELVQDREQWYASRPDYMQRMSQRSSKYLFHIVEELERRGMPTELALLPYIESAFNPQAVSSAKAAGMWQFMPATGNYFDLKQNAFRDDRRDVLASTRAALDYLQKLYGLFGDWHLALAAYNWGEGSVGRAIARNQKAGLGTTYTDLNMPAETRMYVPKLQAVKNIVASPEAFRTELPLIENHPYFQTVDITHDIDVSLVANLAGIREDDFRALNPSFHRPTIFAAGTPQILLPWDNAKVFERNLEARNQGKNASWTVWAAPSTMSVAEAAQRTGMNESELRNLNNIPPRMLIKAGSALMVPRSTGSRQDVSSHLADNGQVALTPEIITRRTTVRAGKRDTVASLAKRYNVSVASLADWNDVKASAAFKAGQQVVLHLPMKVLSSKSPPRTTSAARSSSKPVAAAVQATPRGGKPSKVKRR
ncbi:MAG: transglycosylase SLT domain-containing protein [Burkholderiaceae bacterium]|nr:transglycosylase SLT domain-containing protein [Burkholderiaceae bacterium]